MKTLVVVFAGVFGSTFLSRTNVGAGWFWDLGNALGFVAFAGLVHLSVSSARRLNLAAHRRVGYAVLLVAQAHVFWFLLGDRVVVDYLRRTLSHPLWAGVVAVVLLSVMIALGFPEYRRRMHGDRSGFLRWHRWLAVGTIAFSTWHIVATGHYLRLPSQWVLLIGIAAFASAAPRLRYHNDDLDDRSLPAFFTVAVIATLSFTFVRNLPS